MQETYADLEIRILEKRAGGYPVEMTLNQEREFGPGTLDPGFLPWMPSASSAKDGQRLFDWLFADDRLKAAWTEVRGSCPQRRVRLRIDAAAPELHALPWELLRDGGNGNPPQDLAAATATPFSRYLAGRWQPGSPILKRPIRVLAAVASPGNLGEYGLEAIDPEAEWALLQPATESLDVELVRLPQPCTLGALQEALRAGCHVLHLVAHGAYNEGAGKAVLFLADAENQVERVVDEEFAAMLANELADAQVQNEDKLRLVFLASCQTATRSPADAFRGFAPALVEAGVPAVVAMQDLVPVETAREFARSFYGQLLEHGQVDLAGNQARAALLAGGLPGAAIPVLFMRLRCGRLFGQRILGDRAGSFWSTLLENIEDGWCTPFLGPGVTAGLLPSPVEVAQQLAAEYNYPFPATQSLPRVAQFVGTLDNRRLRQKIVRALAEGHKQRMGLKPDPADRRRGLAEIIGADWSARCLEMYGSEIHHQLADLKLPLYVTTNFDNFMALALRARELEPRRETVAWRERSRRDAQRPHYDLDTPPSAEEPVVMHLFGTDDDPLSMVLTEDDYLDYLARISRDYEYLLPTSVNEALASTTLLFLGYRLQDLDLKVIMRGLLTNLDLEGWGMLHVAVQIESPEVDEAKPEEYEAKLEEVTRYFQRYFANFRIDVYWGSAQQFVDDLHARWQECTHG